jgi:hypothetical protein
MYKVTCSGLILSMASSICLKYFSSIQKSIMKSRLRLPGRFAWINEISSSFVERQGLFILARRLLSKVWIPIENLLMLVFLNYGSLMISVGLSYKDTSACYKLNFSHIFMSWAAEYRLGVHARGKHRNGIFYDKRVNARICFWIFAVLSRSYWPVIYCWCSCVFMPYLTLF